MKILRWFELLIYLVKEIFLAAIEVAGYVLFKGPAITPALTIIPLRVKSPRGIFLLSAMITLTPGSVCVEVEDGEMLVHVIHTDSPDEVMKKIQRGFEDRILALLGEH